MSTLWFDINVIYGYRVNLTLNQCKVFQQALREEPFSFYILIPEINEGLDIEKIKVLMQYFIGFDPKKRSMKTIEILGNCLKEIVKALKLPIIEDLDFYTGINGEPFLYKNSTYLVDYVNFDSEDNIV